jgi:uncharacterized LabA/DUF88 family protein
MSDNVGIFIDGAYLDKVLQEEFNFPKVDFAKLSEWLSQGLPIFRTYYYHCLPYQSDPPTPEEKMRFSKKQSFLNALGKLSRYEVRLGKLEYRGTKKDGTSIFTQKRVDILMGVDIVSLALKRAINNIVILTGDSDFLPAIEVAKGEGAIFTLCYGAAHPPHDDLWNKADERIILRQEIIKT